MQWRGARRNPRMPWRRIRRRQRCFLAGAFAGGRSADAGSAKGMIADPGHRPVGARAGAGSAGGEGTLPLNGVCRTARAASMHDGSAADFDEIPSCPSSGRDGVRPVRLSCFQNAETPMPTLTWRSGAPRGTGWACRPPPPPRATMAARGGAALRTRAASHRCSPGAFIDHATSRSRLFPAAAGRGRRRRGVTRKSGRSHRAPCHRPFAGIGVRHPCRVPGAWAKPRAPGVEGKSVSASGVRAGTDMALARVTIRDEHRRKNAVRPGKRIRRAPRIGTARRWTARRWAGRLIVVGNRMACTR